MQSVIIDLHANGGRVLTESCRYRGCLFLAAPVVQVRVNNGKICENSDTDGIGYYKRPLVVLIDRFSASASEILAAAMRDYGQVLVVGEQTYGKGTIQQYHSLYRIYDQMLRPE